MAVEGLKKRKRDGEAKSKKKVSIQEASSQGPEVIRVSSVMQPQFSAPVLGMLEAILDNSFRRLEHRKSSRSSKRARTTGPNAEMLLHSSSHRTVDFTAKEDRATATDASLQHYIGIFDPVTGELQVVNAKKMEIRGNVRARDASKDQMTGVPVRKTNMDMKNELGQTFGTKKAKKAILSLTENAIGTRKRNADGTYIAEEMGAGDRVLMKTMEEATSSMATREELQAVVDKAKPVPRGNYEAEEIQDVYVPSQIVGADVLASIPVRDWQQAAKAGESIDVYARYVAQRVARVAIRDDALDYLRLMRYMYWLILYMQSARPGKERGTKRQLPREKLKEQMDNCPDTIIQHIRQRFSDNGTIRKFHMDLLTTHCCAFACILDNYEVDMLDLREDLKLEQKQMSQYFSEIGARIKIVKEDDKTKHIAKLALPLRFPNSVRARAKKQR
ncbi:DNA-directed RNA polymerase I subunit rpa49 [Sporothrix eucalyptigena]|uniref:DNA-directed RNA polymerase I subunit rpa49 n=1 Tax=Sporothrix eucalyptigena TaxID=1812306 RepID=A0ABP0BG03_9PEZI